MDSIFAGDLRVAGTGLDSSRLAAPDLAELAPARAWTED